MAEQSSFQMKAVPIELHAERCLDVRHCRAKCSFCADHCPAGAIQINDRQISLDQSICTGCGLCLAVCPMEVFTTPNWTERAVLDFIADLKEDRAELMCLRHPEYDGGSVRPGAVKVRICLGAISPGLLFEAGQLKDIDLRIDACEHCDHKEATGPIETAAALAESWLTAVDCGRHVSLVREVVPGRDVQSGAKLFRFQKAVDADEVRLKRRDFLAGFAREGSSLFAAFLGLAVSKTILSDGDQSSQSFRQPHVHCWREALRSAYPKGSALPGKAAVWPCVRVNKICTGCAVCEKYCPTGALRLHAEADRLRLLFSPGLCTDCGLCALSCPVEAVTRGYAAEPMPFRNQVVLEEPLVLCPRCQSPVLKLGDELCYWCASEPTLESLLEQAKQNLFTPDTANVRPPERT